VRNYSLSKHRRSPKHNRLMAAARTNSPVVITTE
jgi:hypothetical protein